MKSTTSVLCLPPSLQQCHYPSFTSLNIFILVLEKENIILLLEFLVHIQHRKYSCSMYPLLVLHANCRYEHAIGRSLSDQFVVHVLRGRCTAYL